MINKSRIKKCYVVMLLGLSLVLVCEVKANLVGSFTKNYGSGNGQIDPQGDDPLFDGYVLVTQGPSGAYVSAFRESFSSELQSLRSQNIFPTFGYLTFTYADSYCSLMLPLSHFPSNRFRDW